MCNCTVPGAIAAKSACTQEGFCLSSSQSAFCAFFLCSKSEYPACAYNQKPKTSWSDRFGIPPSFGCRPGLPNTDNPEQYRESNYFHSHSLPCDTTTVKDRRRTPTKALLQSSFWDLQQHASGTANVIKCWNTHKPRMDGYSFNPVMSCLMSTL
jgi:hypothetical protein